LNGLRQSFLASPRFASPTRQRYAGSIPQSESTNISLTTTRDAAEAAPTDERDLICKVQDAFRVFARKASAVLGTAWAFVIAIGIIVLWTATGHVFNYSDTWQLIINTGTTIVTFLIVF